jgi:hypothetical protein
MDISSIIEKFRNRGYFRYFLYAIAILAIIVSLIRNSIVQIIFENKCASIKDRYGLTINADKIGISGIRTFYVENLFAKPDSRDTLFRISRAEVKLNFSDLIFLRVNPLEIWLKNPRISFIGEKDYSNYSFLVGTRKDSLQFQNSSIEGDSRQSNPRYAIYRMLKGIFGLTTAKYHVGNFSLSYSDSSYTAFIVVPEFESNEKGFSTQIDILENGSKNSIHLNGLTDKGRSNITLKASMDRGKKPLPLLYHKFGLNISFDTLELRIAARKLRSDDIQLELNSSVKSLEVFSQRLSDQTVKILSGGLKLDITVNSEHYLIDSTSTIDLNGLTAKLYLEYIPDQERFFAFKVAAGAFQSQRFFDALPDGLFINLKGIRTTGTIEYKLDLGVRLDNPDSVYLNPKLITKNFGIAQYGFRNFSALNDTFSHDVYDEGQFIRTIHLGSKNKDFRTIGQISPLIIDAVITSEDGGFFTNSGFDIDAFKYAISENIKQKRFARGGSTITMQLIKNLYLNKNKNLFRKVDEYLIVWLIESQGIITKERLLEIYLNIIEWGPGIYGVNQACHYYFDKDPKEVTLDEAIYLASVIPRPKKFKYLFEKDGNLKSFMEGDFTFIGTKMLQRGMISEEQFNTLLYNVKLTGNAKDQLIDTTSSPSDSLGIDEIRLSSDTTLLLP